MKSVIRDSFDNGRRDRIESPLPFGLYKLIEVRRYPEKVLDTLDKLMKAKKLKQRLGPLCGDSPEGWARGWLDEFAFRLGRDLLPSIEALTGDGLPADVIQPHLAGLLQRERELLSELEHSFWQLRSWGINHEYELWKTGKYKNYDPNTLVDLVAKILSLVPPWVRIYRI